MNPAKVWLVRDLIEKNKRTFMIPVYQRNYDWGTSFCERLYSDIINAFETDKKHFTGTVVYFNMQDSSNFKLDMIIDGQQRITTTFILLKALHDKAGEMGEENLISELTGYIYNKDCSEESKLKLKPIKDDDIQFKLLMQGKISEMNDNSNILKNYRLFIDLIDDSILHGMKLYEILDGMKKLEIIEIVLTKADGDNPQMIFETINSTGLDLTLADKVRNYVLMDDTEQDRLFENYWMYIEKKLGSKDYLIDFFVEYLNYKVPGQVSENSAYDIFKEYFEKYNYTHETMLKELKHYSEIYASFVGCKNHYSEEINNILNEFREIDQSTLYPFLFAIFDDYEQKILCEEVLMNMLKLLRTYCVKRLVCEVPSNSLRGFFKSLYGRLYKDTKLDYYEKLYALLMTLTTKDRMPSDKEYNEKLITLNLYSKKKLCRYILLQIENGENKEPLVVNSKITIEHILPQKENNLTWKKEIGEDKYSDVYVKYLHTLGNLTITGYNSELGTKPFEEKKRIIKENSKANVLNENILNQVHWGENQIVNRAQKLAQKISKILEYKECHIQNKNEETENKITLDELDLVTGTEPYMMSFAGETTNVATYAEVIVKMINVLYDLDKKIIERLADEKYKPTKTGRIYITNNREELARPRELEKTGIYFELNLSAKDIMKFIKNLLSEYDLLNEEFYIYFKNDDADSKIENKIEKQKKGKITSEMTTVVFQNFIKWENEAISYSECKDTIVSQTGMNESSVEIYLDVLSKLIEGTGYKRAIKIEDLEFFMRMIKKTFGEAVYNNANKSVEQWIEYAKGESISTEKFEKLLKNL